MKTGFLFPGQGSQNIGMGKDIYDNFESARKIYQDVREITGIDVAEISFEDSNGLLNQTKYTQICILTMSLAVATILKENGIKAEMMAGLSLGEYSALIASEKLSFTEGVKLVKNRGEYMQDLCPKGDWQMAAIMGMTETQVIQACEKVEKGFAVPVNFNTIGQIVVSGDKTGIEEIEKIAKAMGAKKVRILNTSGPFHTEKLTKAAETLKKDLEKVSFNNSNIKVIKNLDGKEYLENDNMPEILSKHIVSPVKFTDILKNMHDSGIDTFIEVGPGKTLSGFVKRMDFENINIFNVNDIDSLNNLLLALQNS